MRNAAERVILLGDDGSPGADLAWRWIDAQRWPGWRVEVVTAEPPPLGPPPEPAETEPHPWDPPDPRAPSPSSGLGSVRHLRCLTDPRVALLRPDADLIVVGPRGEGLLKSLHLGSTAEFLLHHPPDPLVIARSGDPVRRVLVCADGSPHASAAAATLRSLPWIGSIHARVLGVDDGISDVDRGVEEARRELGEAPGEVAVRTRRGQAAWTIFREAEDLGADLVVMGTRGMGVLRRLLVGSNASAVARAAPCSVLTVHAGGPPGEPGRGGSA